MLLLIDNHDSFTYNLSDYFKQLNIPVKIIKNDAITNADLGKIKPSALVISPGPGTPKTAGVSLSAIDYFIGKIPILGVCLGHQAIGEYFGANIIKAPEPMHGKLTMITHDNQALFYQQPNPLQVVRYHSLIVERDTLPNCLDISAQTEDGIIMAMRHKTLPIEGVQFHPEAILTQNGLLLLRQFLIHNALLSES